MLRILSLGAGVQSTVLALMSARGDLPKLNAAIFADTGWESRRVYDHVDWLEERLPFPIIRVKRKGPNLGDSWTGVVDGSIPRSGSSLPGFFMSPAGMSPFQCSKEFKTRVVNREVVKLLGVEEGKRASFKTPVVEMWLGMDYDEGDRLKDNEKGYICNRWPLFELAMRRRDCLRWMEERQYPRPPRSACIFCPFRSDAEWYDLQTESPDDFIVASAFDKSIRPGWPGMKGEAFLHRSLKPLDEIDFSPPADLFSIAGTAATGDWGLKQECDGACGT